MQVQIFGEKHLEVTDALKEHIQSKCSKFNTLVGNSVVNVRLRVDEQKKSHTKIDIHHEGHDYHIEKMNPTDMYNCITEAVNSLRKQITDKKPKHKA